MSHPRGKVKSASSLKRAFVGPPPPSPPATPSKTVNCETKRLLKNLRAMDEFFQINDDSAEQQLRMQLLEERQRVLQNLCEIALQQDEYQRQLDLGVESTPQSIKSLPPRECSRNVARDCGAGLARLNSLGKTSAASSTALRAGAYRPLASPLLFDDSALEEDRRFVEEFLATPEKNCSHPYAGDGTLMSHNVENAMPLSLKIGSRGLLESGTVATKKTDQQEYFDMMEEKQLLKCILLHEQQRAEKGTLHKSGAASPPLFSDAHTDRTANVDLSGGMSLKAKEDAQNSVVGDMPLVNSIKVDLEEYKSRKKNADCTFSSSFRKGSTADNGKRNGKKTPCTTDTGTEVMQELLQENRSLRREVEVQNAAIREFKLKTESLARHVVKFMRERTQLRNRVEQLEGLLDSSTAEVKKLQEDVTEQNSLVCGDVVWRAAAHTKERELRICEDELSHLRDIVDQHLLRTGNKTAQQTDVVTIAQMHSDVNELLHELGIALVSRREAETHANRLSEELEAAQLHIQALDKHLADVERSLSLRQLHEIREHFLSQDDSLQEFLSLPSAQPPVVKDLLATWPADAKREITHLALYAESLIAQHAKSDSRAESRLSRVRQENNELRDRCCKYETEMEQLQKTLKSLRQEKTLWKSRECCIQQQFLLMQDDAALITTLLRTTGKKGERVLELLIASGVEQNVKVVVEAFVKSVSRDFNTVCHFLAMLQRMGHSDTHKQESEKLLLSTTTRERMDFVLQAVEDAWARKMTSTLFPPTLQHQRSQTDQEQREVNPLSALFLVSPVASHHTTTVQDVTKEQITKNGREEEVERGKFIPCLNETVPSCCDSSHSKKLRGDKMRSRRKMRTLDPPVKTPRETLEGVTNKHKMSSVAPHGDSNRERLRLSPDVLCRSGASEDACDQPLQNTKSFLTRGFLEVSCDVAEASVAAFGGIVKEKTEGCKDSFDKSGVSVEQKSISCSPRTVLSDNDRPGKIANSAVCKDEDSSRCRGVPDTSSAPNSISTSTTVISKVSDAEACNNVLSAPKRNQGDVVTQLSLPACSGPIKESKVTHNKATRAQYTSADNDFSEPHLKMPQPSKLEPQEEEIRAKQQPLQPFANSPTHQLPPDQRSKNLDCGQAISVEVTEQAVPTVFDAPRIMKPSSGQVPTHLSPSAGGRFGGCAPSIYEPQRHTTTSLPVAELKPAGATDVPDTGPRRRALLVTDFPSLRHSRFDPERQEIGQAASGSLDQKS